MKKRKRRGKNNGIIKKVIIVIAVIILIFCVLIGYAVYNMTKQEEVLTQEVINWSNKNLLKDNFEINIKTKGEYAYVENAIKKFYKKLSNNVKQLYYYLESDELTNILSIENLQNDRPNFIKSNNTISTVKANATTAINNIASLCDEETIKSLLDKDKVDDYYIDIYKKLMYTEQDLKNFKETKAEMEELSKNLNIFLDKIQEILNLLEKNNNNWMIENGQLYFSSDSLVNQYNTLYKELQTIVTEKLSGTEKKKKEEIQDTNI